jgi:four helix bundle protein
VPGARHFTDLIVWQLGDQLRTEVFRLTRTPRFAADFKLRAQTDDAVDSVCRNIAEGFACGNREFARFLRISRRSLNELQDQFRSATLKGYVTDGDLMEPRRLIRRMFPAYAALISHLDRRPGGGR